MADLELKFAGGTIREASKTTRNGVPVGIVEGYIATWDVDKADPWGERDQFQRGAFSKSIAEHKARGTMPLVRDEHGRTVGGFQADSLREDDVGLFGVAEINLDVQQGAELYSLAKQQVKNHWSVGFHATQWSFNDANDLRVIREAEIVEGSLVDIPRNDAAIVTEVKAVTTFQNLPLAAPGHPWNASAARQRVREFTNSQDAPGREYRKAFLWWDSAAPEDFGAYKLPYADVIEGALTAVPRALNAAKSRLEQTDIPDADRAKVLRNIEKYQDKTEGAKMYFKVPEIKALKTKRDIENVLRESGAFSNDAATALAARFTTEDQGEPGTADIELKAALDKLEGQFSLESETERELNKILEGLTNV